jgi:hypothetical protein
MEVRRKGGRRNRRKKGKGVTFSSGYKHSQSAHYLGFLDNGVLSRTPRTGWEEQGLRRRTDSRKGEG